MKSTGSLFQRLLSDVTALVVALCALSDCQVLFDDPNHLLYYKHGERNVLRVCCCCFVPSAKARFKAMLLLFHPQKPESNNFTAESV